MKTPHILAISSYAVHGTASLKTFTTLLGEKLLPVPSVMLNGLTNMQLVKKFTMPFRELLQSTFELAVNRDLDLILYIGYLGNAEQASIIMEMIAEYQSHILTVITDPVCGDNGRTYVPQAVIDEWPMLIDLAEIAFPNLTELKILTGHSADDEQSVEHYAKVFKRLYPSTNLVVTSLKTAYDGIGIAYFADETFTYSHKLLPRNFGGTGDAFLAQYLHHRYYKKLPITDALKLATDDTYRLIELTIAAGTDDLLLSALKL